MFIIFTFPGGPWLPVFPFYNRTYVSEYHASLNGNFHSGIYEKKYREVRLS